MRFLPRMSPKRSTSIKPKIGGTRKQTPFLKLVPLQIGLFAVSTDREELMIHLFCRDVQTNEAPETDESDRVNVVHTDRGQAACGQKGDKSRDHDKKTEDGQLFAYFHQRLALLSALQVTGIADRTHNQSHEQTMQSGIEHHMAKNCPQSLSY